MAPHEHSSTDPDDTGSVGFASVQVGDAPTIKIRTIFQRFWPDTRPFRGRMLLSLALTGVTPAATTVSIWLFKLLVDDVLTPADYRPFPPIAAAYLGITVVSGLVTYADEYLSAWVAERFVMGLRIRLFDHLGSLSVGFFEKRPLGDILSRLTSDVTSIESLVLTGVNLVLTYSFQIVFYAVALLLLDWRLTLIASVAAPAFLVMSRVLSRRIAQAARELRRRSGSITSVAEESLANTALVQAYDRRSTETERFRGENEASFRAGMRATRLEGLFGPVSNVVQAIGVLLVIGFAVHELASGVLTLGGLLVFVTYLSQLYGPVAGFGGLANSLFAAGAGAERIIEVLDTRPGVIEPERPRPLGRAAGALAMEDVDFGYPDTGRPALSGLSFRITPGERVAVVGASGAGKTTVTKLLLRFYDPDHGRVTLDGRDLRDLPLSDLRANITAVLQDTLVFDGTVEENIRWARPGATDDEIVAAARAADVHEFVSALPDGYRTRIGQRGRMLSGGQRQRLAIARAVVRDAPVLVLDEPTTGLDAEATERVLAPLRRLMASRTTLVISHNLLTVTDSDRILYLHEGELSAAGTHEELLRDSPGYARLYALHRSGEVPDEQPHDVRPATADPHPESATTRLPVVARRDVDPVDPDTAALPVVPILATARLPVLATSRVRHPGPAGTHDGHRAAAPPLRRGSHRPGRDGHAGGREPDARGGPGAARLADDGGSGTARLTDDSGSGTARLTDNGGSGTARLTDNGGSGTARLTDNGGPGTARLTDNGGPGTARLTDDSGSGRGRLANGDAAGDGLPADDDRSDGGRISAGGGRHGLRHNGSGGRDPTTGDGPTGRGSRASGRRRPDGCPPSREPSAGGLDPGPAAPARAAHDSGRHHRPAPADANRRASSRAAGDGPPGSRSARHRERRPATPRPEHARPEPGGADGTDDRPAAAVGGAPSGIPRPRRSG